MKAIGEKSEGTAVLLNVIDSYSYDGHILMLDLNSRAWFPIHENRESFIP